MPITELIIRNSDTAAVTSCSRRVSREVVNCDKLNKVLSLSLVTAILHLQH